MDAGSYGLRAKYLVGNLACFRLLCRPCFR
jgi:hypothetical protein